MKSYRTKQALQILNGFGFPGLDITQNQLVHWAEKRVLVPTIQDAAGYSSYREYAFKDLVKAAMIGRLLSVGMDLNEIRLIFDEYLENNFAFDYGKGYSDLWDALRKDPENYSFFCKVAFQHKDQSPRVFSSGYFFCKDIVEALKGDQERIRAEHGTDAYLKSGRFINVTEILEVLERRTGDKL